MKRAVMKRTWEIYRTLTGDRNAKLSHALKQAWSEVITEDMKKKTSENDLRIGRLDFYSKSIIVYNYARTGKTELKFLDWTIDEYDDDYDEKAERSYYFESLESAINFLVQTSSDERYIKWVYEEIYYPQH